MNSLDDVFYSAAGLFPELEYRINKNFVSRYHNYTTVGFRFYDGFTKEEYLFRLSFSLNEIYISPDYPVPPSLTTKYRMSLLSERLKEELTQYFLSLPNFRIKMAIKSLDVGVSDKLLFSEPKDSFLHFLGKRYYGFPIGRLILALFLILLISFSIFLGWHTVVHFSFGFLSLIKGVLSFLLLVFGSALITIFVQRRISEIREIHHDYKLFKKYKRSLK